MNNERREISARDSSERPNSKPLVADMQRRREADYTGKYRARSQGELSKDSGKRKSADGPDQRSSSSKIRTTRQNEHGALLVGA